MEHQHAAVACARILEQSIQHGTLTVASDQVLAGGANAGRGGAHVPSMPD